MAARTSAKKIYPSDEIELIGPGGLTPYQLLQSGQQNEVDFEKLKVRI